MVFFPKPGLVKELGSEFVGSTLYYFAASTVVAVTGGSVAFSTNGTAVAVTQGAAVLFLTVLLPFVLYNPVYVMYMVFNDLICWIRGKEGPIYILRYFLTLLIQLGASVVAALLTWIYVPAGDPFDLGITRTPAGTSNLRAFFALAVASFFAGLVWIVVSENMTALYSYGMAQLRAAAEAKKSGKARDARKNMLPNKGQSHLALASFIRGIVMFAVIIIVTFFIQPVVGYCINPTQYLGYAIVSWTWDPQWPIHLFAPFAGGFVAYLLYLPYTFSSTWGPLTKYYGRGRGRGVFEGMFK